MRLKVKDVARLLHVSERTVWRLADDGEVPAHQVNQQYLFNRVELLEWAAERQLPLASEILRGSSADPAESQGLGAALDEGGIFYSVPGTYKAAVLRAVVDLLPLPEAVGREVDRETLLQILRAQEDLASSAIRDGIVVPHVRHPIVLPVPRPMVTACFPEEPVDFGAPDGKPVRVVFTIVAPTIRSNMRLLSRLVGALGDHQFKDALAREAPPSEIIREARRAETRAGEPRGV